MKKLTASDVQRVCPALDSAQATEVITLMENDGAPPTKQAIKVFAQWLYEISLVQWTGENVTKCNKPTNN
jgi:hypothetical protein